MYGPSVTPLARTVLAVSGESSWCPASASLPELPSFSYQAPISAIHASKSGPLSRWPVSVTMPSNRYFITRLRISRTRAPRRHPLTDSHERPTGHFDIAPGWLICSGQAERVVPPAGSTPVLSQQHTQAL